MRFVHIPSLLMVALLTVTAAWGHSPGDGADGTPAAEQATAKQVATFTKLLGKKPRQAYTFADSIAVVVTAAPDKQQALAVIDLYLQIVRHMPGTIAQDVRISGFHLLGDMVAFRGDAKGAVFDYIWDSEEPGPPFWRRTPTSGGVVNYSPNVDASLVAPFYLRDPLRKTKLDRADAVRKEKGLHEILYVDSAVLILATASASQNLALRWMRDDWVEAGVVEGVVNHHAMADLNGDGLIELLAGDSTIVEVCISTWNVLYTWNAAKSAMVQTPIRAESTSNLSGQCAQRPDACYREESLTWNRTVRPWPELRLSRKQDTTGCPGKDVAATQETSQRRFAWNPRQGAFAELGK